MFENLIKWSQDNYSHLPWRTNRSVYNTLVSEIMLQQTTVQTVINHFDNFLKKYPTVKMLAASTEEEVCVAWKGLGYYRRARNLRKAAIAIEEKFNGKIPTTYEELLLIDGVGDYTASALVAIGNNLPAIAIDANIERVLARFYAIDEEKGIKLNKKIKEIVFNEKVFNNKKNSPRALNEALMDLGRTHCQAKKTSCELCPLRSQCQAFSIKKILNFPKLKPETKKSNFHELDLLRVIVRKNKSLLVFKKNDKEWLSGQFECPTFILRSEDKKLKQYPVLKTEIDVDNLKKYKTSITKYKITNFILELSPTAFKKLGFASETQFIEISKESNFSTATFKALTHLNT